MRSGAVLFSSTSSLAHSRKIVALYVSDSSRACPTSLFLFSSVSLELHERGVTRQTCLARFCRFLCMFPYRARIPATSQHPWHLSCGPLWQPAQRDSRKASLSSMSGNLRLQAPATPANLAPLYLPHPRLPSLPSSCSSPSLTRGKSHRGLSQSPQQRLTLSPLAILTRVR